jgi:Thioesterase domain
MRIWRRVTAIGVLALGLMLALGASPSRADSRGHVYLLRGLMNIFSLGMDTLADELSKRGVYATVDNHSSWQTLADQAVARYKAGTEGPIVIIGHSLGADAAMEMANYIGARGVPVALVVPFDGTQSLAAGANVQRVLNLTQRQYAYMRRGSGFKGTLANVDVSSDPSIDHLNIDKSPRLHARVIGEVVAVIGNHRGTPAPGTPGTPGTLGTPGVTPAPKPTPVSAPQAAPSGGSPAAKPEAPAPPSAPAAPVTTPGKTGGAMNGESVKPAVADSGTPLIAAPEKGTVHVTPEAVVVAPPVHKPATPQQPVSAAQLPN